MKVCERRRTELYAKQGRKNQFTTAEARDKWITEVNVFINVFNTVGILVFQLVQRNEKEDII